MMRTSALPKKLESGISWDYSGLGALDLLAPVSILVLGLVFVRPPGGQSF